MKDGFIEIYILIKRNKNEILFTINGYQKIHRLSIDDVYIIKTK